ncbi:hypothetical protein [Curtobacterium sp. MCSS17_008]|uniref:hypothetical protein n=1 Tax=Curtobacterium sp. MCSS17_008 TaxID=2175647 RepID=UPI001C653422|nr:hypothetical protein [Curtobacterium sp. MCSS17_008]
MASDRRRSPMLVAVTVGTLLISLSGCSASGALTPLQARDSVEAAPGVKSATVTTGRVQETLGSTYYVDVRVDLEQGIDPMDLPHLVDYIAATGWATDIKHKPAQLQLNFGGAADFDMVKVLRAMNVEAIPGFDRSSASVTAAHANKKWGQWPTRAPAWK